ncbi:MAG: CDP-diacylglycerol--serine O-phosphatidyltransferase [Candidatus Delongbacteria bacterium]|jgi:CDP-diacylglycerol--serine O-phosphatidyltransferase|nr:CDP-diacylglycerol--serine O-phosphatidyltransferase [Candidatus Delongbacteria bacterium]
MANRMSIFPNSLTIGNMFFGFWSIISAFEGNYVWAAYFVMLGGVCDALDGKVARLVKSTSDFGVEFDSLADLVTFGMAPSILMYNLYTKVYPGIDDLKHLIIFVSFMPLMFTGIRLARFNTELVGHSKKFFSGLPSPAAAMTIISFVLFEFETYGRLVHFKWLTATSIIVSYLMISRMKYQGFPVMFKRKESFLKRNLKIVGVILLIAVVVKFKMSLLFPMMVFFVLSGIVGNIIEKMKSEDKEIEKE